MKEFLKFILATVLFLPLWFCISHSFLKEIGKDKIFSCIEILQFIGINIAGFIIAISIIEFINKTLKSDK